MFVVGFGEARDAGFLVHVNARTFLIDSRPTGAQGSDPSGPDQSDVGRSAAVCRTKPKGAGMRIVPASSPALTSSPP